MSDVTRTCADGHDPLSYSWPEVPLCPACKFSRLLAVAADDVSLLLVGLASSWGIGGGEVARLIGKQREERQRQRQLPNRAPVAIETKKRRARKVPS